MWYTIYNEREITENKKDRKKPDEEIKKFIAHSAESENNMEIKFIVNGKSFSTLCKTVKTATKFNIECTDIFGYNAIFSVDTSRNVIHFESVNGKKGTGSAGIPDYVKTEKTYKTFLMNFIKKMCTVITGRENYMLTSTNLLSYLCEGVTEKSEAFNKDMEENVIPEEPKKISYHGKFATFERHYSLRTGELVGIFKECTNTFATTDKKFCISYNLSSIRFEKEFNFLTNAEMDFLYTNSVGEIEFEGKKYDLIDFISALLDKEMEEKDTFLDKIPRPLLFEKNSFLSKKIMIRNGLSDVYQRYSKICPLLPRRDFISAIYWLCSDPRSLEGKTTRAITITSNGIKKLHKVNCVTFTNFFEAIGGKKWVGEIREFDAVTEHQKKFADENGKLYLLDKSVITADNKI